MEQKTARRKAQKEREEQLLQEQSTSRDSQVSTQQLSAGTAPKNADKEKPLPGDMACPMSHSDCAPREKQEPAYHREPIMQRQGPSNMQQQGTSSEQTNKPPPIQHRTTKTNVRPAPLGTENELTREQTREQTRNRRPKAVVRPPITPRGSAVLESARRIEEALKCETGSPGTDHAQVPQGKQAPPEEGGLRSNSSVTPISNPMTAAPGAQP